MYRLRQDPRFKERFPDVVEEEADERPPPSVTVRLRSGEGADD